LVRGERGGCLDRRPNRADPHAEPAAAQPLDELGEEAAVRFHDEEQGPPVVRPHGGRMGGW
jgi:hypothetical protein